jgi:hypothetical protein
MAGLPEFPSGSFIESPVARASKQRANVLFILLILVLFGIEDEDDNEDNCELSVFLDSMVLIILGITAFANKGRL